MHCNAVDRTFYDAIKLAGLQLIEQTENRDFEKKNKDKKDSAFTDLPTGRQAWTLYPSDPFEQGVEVKKSVYTFCNGN